MMMIKGMRHCVLAVALLALLACEKKEDGDFVLAYAELRIAEREYGKTEEGKEACLKILQSHAFSADDFEKRIEEIKKEPQRWQDFQNKLVKILDSIADSLKKEGGT